MPGEPDSYLRFMLAFILVLALIGAAATIARRFGFGYRLPTKGGRRRRRLNIVEVMPLDARRRLVLFRRDGVEHLILVGAQADLVVETGIPAPADPPFATLVREETAP